MKKIYLFTGTYPYAFRESFLEQEVPILANTFDEVVIIPFSGANTKMRSIPNGVRIDNRLQCSRKSKIILGILNVWRVIPLYFIDFFKNKIYQSKYKTEIWFKSIIITSFYLQSKPVKELSKIVTQEDILYYYWGVEYNSIAPYFKDKCIQVSRFHGDWDLWRDGGTKDIYSPCRDLLMASLDCAVTISDKGNRFLEQRYPFLNVKTFRLGAMDNGMSKKSNDKILRFLSCSSVYPLKRVDYIFECLFAFSESNNIKIYWTHIGDGPQFDYLRNIVETKVNPNMKVNLLGRLVHNDVLSFYRNNMIDVFLNLSINEGIPVSVMEAISFNVPVIATNVGATNEIVNNTTGELVSPNPSVDEIVYAIKRVVSRPKEPRKYWRENYDAYSNYSKFANYVKTLSK